MKERLVMEKEIIIAGGGARGLYFVKMLTEELHRKVAAVAESNIQAHPTVRNRLQEFGTPNTRIFSSIDEALAQLPRSVADIVFVMTPEWTHLDVFSKAVRADCHVFLEKPIATTDSDVREIVRLARHAKTTIQVGFVLRYSAYYQAVKKIIEDGLLGNIVMIQMNERLPLRHGAVFCRTWHRKTAYTGGMLNEKCCHDLDVMLWLKGKEGRVARVSSFAGRHFTPPKDTPQHCPDCKIPNCPFRFTGMSNLNCTDGRPIQDATWGDYDGCVFRSDADIFDHQSLNVQFADGTQGMFTIATTTSMPGRDIRIFGTDGCLMGQLEEGQLLVQNYWHDKKPRQISLLPTNAHGGGDVPIVAGFLKSIGTQERPLATVSDGARASLLAFAADKSAKTGQIISFNNDVFEDIAENAHFRA